MINLKEVITKYPECLASPEKLKAYLTDLYPDRNDRIISGYIITVAESGFPTEIKELDEISFAQYRKYVDNIVSTTGMDTNNAEKAAEMWMNVLSVRLGKNGNNAEIPADHVHKYHKTVVPSNCTQKGYTKYWCDCGYEYNADFTRPSSCRFTIIEQKDATCRHKGYVKSRCLGCGKEQTEEIPVKEHSWGPWNTLISPTCQIKGKRTRKCTECGTAETDMLAMLPHDFGKWHEQVHPLCETEGKEVRVCNHCKTVEEKILPAVGHKWSAWETTPDGQRLSRFCPQCGKEEFKAKPPIMVGGIIEFGAYPQNRSKKDKTPIKWRILAKKDNKTLVISEKALDCQPYNTSYTEVTWETCSLRKWMNGTFFSSAFSAKEQAQIQSTTVSADKNPEYSTNPGNDTTDKVFLLSITEVEKYFSSNEDRKCVPTEYAIAQGALTSDIHKKGGAATCWWWLRSPGATQITAALVYDFGSVGYFGHLVHTDNGCVRPALWINLDS